MSKPGTSVGTGGTTEIEETFPMIFQGKRRPMLWNVIDLNCQIFRGSAVRGISMSFVEPETGNVDKSLLLWRVYSLAFSYTFILT